MYILIANMKVVFKYIDENMGRKIITFIYQAIT